ncbi:MAG: hypothetical protein LBI84_05930 [Propionibacteriaceae bacterium]|jgi:hypothetical protein|nr:hypothetical protein [Propionibacteriaceae bacterium]
MTEPSWESSLAAALTGADLDLPAVGSAASLVDALAERGWTAEAIAGQARAAWASGAGWPYPADAAALARFGAARWEAALSDLRGRLGLAVAVQPPSRRTRLSADERRLLAEVPPHHGS